MIAGCEPAPAGSKQSLIQNTIAAANDLLARKIVEELIYLLRESGYLDEGKEDVLDRLKSAFREGGHELDPVGYVSWDVDGPDDGTSILVPVLRREAAGDGREARPAPWHDDQRMPSVDGPTGPARVDQSAVAEVTSPDLGLLISSLRRLGMGAARPLIQRRHPKDRVAFSVTDEYDIQDLVEVVLRSLYGDVRNEEWTPSSAGSSSRIDTFIREGRTAVEIKVTRPGRAETALKKEVLVDINDYQNHPGVKAAVIAVYDLAAAIRNPEGFEHDLSGQHKGLDVRLLVIPWVGPLTPTT
jgi:hypothetical protein